jgi:predicted dehydrogenase
MSKKLRIGIIGAGGIAQGCHMKGYATMPDLCEMVAVCDVFEETAKKAAEKFGVSKVYTDYKEMIASGEIDAVSVATPNKFHKDPTIDCLNAGIHVLCEKPLAMNADEAKEMCAAALHRRRKHGRHLLCSCTGSSPTRRPTLGRLH